MALKGGSLIVGTSAVALSGAVPGRLMVRSISFVAPNANTQVLAVGGSNVESDGQPAYFSLSPGGSYTPPLPGGEGKFEVDFTALYARAAGAGQTLQIVYID